MSQATGSIEVDIKGNTMQVANEMYHLGNISRVSTYTNLVGFHGSALKAIWLKKWRIAFVLLLFILGAGMSRGGGVVIVVALLGGLVIAYQIMQMLNKKRTEYVLRLESAGVVRGVLASNNAAAIENLVGEISNAIRNPEIAEQHLHLDGVWTIDKADINQYGNHNTGIQHSG